MNLSGVGCIEEVLSGYSSAFSGFTLPAAIVQKEGIPVLV
jgi:hypothetical protein